MSDNTPKNLDTLIDLLTKAAHVADAIKSQAPDDNDLPYQAMMWSDYLKTFRREVTAQAKTIREAR